MQPREKEAYISNRLLDGRGHLVPEAEVVLHLSVSCLPFFLSGGSFSGHFASTVAYLGIQTSDPEGTSCLFLHPNKTMCFNYSLQINTSFTRFDTCQLKGLNRQTKDVQYNQLHKAHKSP